MLRALPLRLQMQGGGRGCPTPNQSPRFFKAEQSLLQSIRVPSKPMMMMRALRLQTHGGGAVRPPTPPNPPALFFVDPYFVDPYFVRYSYFA